MAEASDDADDRGAGANSKMGASGPEACGTPRDRATDAPTAGVTYVITVRKVEPGETAYVAEEPPSPWTYRRR